MRRNKPLILMMLSMVVWGASNPISDLAVEHMSPIAVFVIQMLCGLLIFFIVSIFVPSLRRSFKFVPWRIAIPFGLLQPGLAYLLGNIGWQYASVTTGVILMSSEVIFLALGGALFLREKLSLWSVIALLVGVSGAIIVGIAGQAASPEASGKYVNILGISVSAGLVGALAFLGVGLSGAIYGLLMRRLKTETNTIGLTLGQMISASGFSILLAIVTRTEIPTPATVGNYFYVAVLAGIVGTSLPYLLFNYAVPKLTTKQTAITLNLIPVVAILFGSVLGRGLPVGAQYVGIILVLISLLALETGHDEDSQPKTASPAFPGS